MKLTDLPVLAGVFLLALASLIIAAVLLVKTGNSPTELMLLPTTGMGILGGAYMGTRGPVNNDNDNPPPV